MDDLLFTPPPTTLKSTRTQGVPHRQRCTGERKRKSICGCIAGQDIAVLNLAVIKTGDAAIAGLTDNLVPSRLGPKRANKIRALFNLTKDDNVNVRKYVISRTFASKKGKEV